MTTVPIGLHKIDFAIGKCGKLPQAGTVRVVRLVASKDPGFRAIKTLGFRISGL